MILHVLRPRGGSKEKLTLLLGNGWDINGL